jgi:hypothetical protein
VDGEPLPPSLIDRLVPILPARGSGCPQPRVVPS